MRIFLSALLIFLLAANVYALEVGVGGTFQDLDLSGKVQSKGTEIDLESDLGMGGDEPVGISLTVDGKKHHLLLSFASIKFGGGKTLSRTVQFRDQTYNVNTFVQSKFEYDLYEVQYNYDFLHLKKKNFGFSLGPLLKISLYDATVNLKTAVRDETYSAVLPIPTIGLAGSLDFTKYFSLLGQVNGLGSSDDNYVEYKALFRVKPIPYFHFDVGYKGMNIDVSSNDNSLDLETKGLLLQAGFVYKF